MTERKSIIRTRIAQKEVRRKKRSKFFMFTMGSVTLIGIMLILVIGTKIYSNFQETRQWEKSSLNGTYANIPPEFAKNVITADMTDDINSLSEISKLIEEIKSNAGLTESGFNQAQTLLARAQKIFERYNITGGEAFKNAEMLDLYVSLYNLEANQYTNPNPAGLSEIIAKFNTKVLNEPTEADKKILERLSALVSDYQNLINFQETYIPKMGVISNGVVSINTDMSESLTDEMIGVIDSQGLTKFNNIDRLKTLLKSEEWSKSVKNNDRKRDKDAYSLAEIAFGYLSKNHYVSVKDFTTYSQVKDTYTVYGIEEKDGYLINTDSPITKVFANGIQVSSDVYVKKTASLEFYVTPTYTKIQETPASSTTFDSSSSSSSSSSITSSSATVDLPQTPSTNPSSSTTSSSDD